MLHMRMECRMSRMYPAYEDHSEQLRDYTRSSSPVMKKYSLREYREMNAYMSVSYTHLTLPTIYSV